MQQNFKKGPIVEYQKDAMEYLGRYKRFDGAFSQ
jgi:hypothetical protein